MLKCVCEVGRCVEMCVFVRWGGVLKCVCVWGGLEVGRCV